MSVAKMIIALLLYYVILGIGFSAMVYGGMITEERMDNSITYAGSDYRINDTVTADEITASNSLQTLLAFLTFDVDIGLPSFANWIVSIMFIWVPAIIMGLLIFYSLRSGGA